MQKVFLRILAAAMTLALMLSMAPAAHAADSGNPAADVLRQSVEQQIRAYAKSINQSGADDDAATALAMHGIGGGGKTMTVGANHSLTATIWNSELFQTTMINGCAEAIRAMQQVDHSQSLPLKGYAIWQDNDYSYSIYSVRYIEGQPKPLRDWSLAGKTIDAKTTNSYDQSLTWMTGIGAITMTIDPVKITASEITYRVSCSVKDRFDFSTSSSDGFKNLISGMGALLFKEFDWESSVTFDLTTPYSCPHRSGNYRWTYNGQTQQMLSDSSNGYTANAATRKEYQTKDGETKHYYELAETVRLSHDKPWVLEYDVKDYYSLVLSPLKVNFAPTLPSIFQSRGSSYFLFRGYTALDDDKVYGTDYYGVQVSSHYKYSSKQPYTFHLENRLHPDGSNMVYLSVWKTDTGAVLVDNVPMDDHYRNDSSTDGTELQSESDDRMRSLDWYINYFGNLQILFSLNTFELRVWENGIGGDSCSYITDKVVKPTCTARGYVQHTCTLCGYSYNTDYIAAKGHQFGAYADNNNATCTTDGTKTAKCSTCGVTDTVSIPGSAKGHQFGVYANDNNTTCTEDGTKTAKCSTCGVTDTVTIVGSAPGHSFIHQTVPPSTSSGGYTRHTCTVCKYYYTDGFTDPLTGTKGDFTGDKKVTDEDAIYLLWHTLFPTNYPLSTSGDLTGDGKVTDEDAVYLLWHTLFPTRYPLTA